MFFLPIKISRNALDSSGSSNNINATETENTQKRWIQKDVIEYVICAYHALVTIISICLVSILFFKGNDGSLITKQQNQHSTATYIMSPKGGCKLWGNGECIVVDPEHNNMGNKEKLWGLLHMEERKAMGLFSSTNAAVVCLTAQLIAACLTAASAPLQSKRSRFIFSIFGIGALGVYGIALLFLQNTWQIPGNNLVWLEITLISSIMVAVNLATNIGCNANSSGSKSNNMYHGRADPPLQGNSCSDDAENNEQQQARIIGSFFSVPMLCIAGLVTAGESNAISLRISYVGLVGVAVLWLIEQMSDARAEEMVALRVTPWLCLIPFIMVTSLRLQVMAVLPNDQRWAIFELSLILAWALVILIYFTISGVIYIWTVNEHTKANNNNDYQTTIIGNHDHTSVSAPTTDYYFVQQGQPSLFSYNSDGIHVLNTDSSSSYPTEPYWKFKTEWVGYFFYAFHQLMHSAIVLLILTGLFVNAS